MDFISKIDNAHAWLKRSGIYSQAELYRRGEQIFAKLGSGYVRLSCSGTTSAPRIVWMEIDTGDNAQLVLRDGHAPAWKEAVAEPAQKPKTRLRKVA